MRGAIIRPSSEPLFGVVVKSASGLPFQESSPLFFYEKKLTGVDRMKKKQCFPFLSCLFCPSLFESSFACGGRFDGWQAIIALLSAA
jgi:hypothetical protein